MKELALNILDIAQNSIRAKARQIEIQIEESEFRNLLRIRILDDGVGIPPEMLANVVDPYITSRTKRRVGLGLAFLKQHAEFAGGRLKIDSREGKGTRVEAWFLLNHIDRQPMGDISGVVKILIVANPLIEFLFEYRTDIGEYRIDTREIKEIIEVKDLTDNNLMDDVRMMILENLKIIDVKD